MLNRDFFKKIRFNRCEMLLSESETYFLYSRFKKLILLSESKNRIFSKSNVSKVLLDFCRSTNKRYFLESDVKYIANYYINSLKEEIGRGREGGFDQISNHTIIEDEIGITPEEGVNAHEESESIVFLDGDEAVSEVNVDNPDAAHVYMTNLKTTVIANKKR